MLSGKKATGKMNPCLKQTTRCIIIREDGRRYEAVNLCAVDANICPRIAAGCKTGEGYELCGSTHAEANCAKLAEESKQIPGTAYLYGHTWFCGPCQWALTAVNVKKFVITDKEKPAVTGLPKQTVWVSGLQGHVHIEDTPEGRAKVEEIVQEAAEALLKWKTKK